MINSDITSKVYYEYSDISTDGTYDVKRLNVMKWMKKIMIMGVVK
jgi:hypothetical protein